MTEVACIFVQVPLCLWKEVTRLDGRRNGFNNVMLEENITFVLHTYEVISISIEAQYTMSWV